MGLISRMLKPGHDILCPGLECLGRFARSGSSFRVANPRIKAGMEKISHMFHIYSILIGKPRSVNAILT